MSPPMALADAELAERARAERVAGLESRIEDALRRHGPLHVRRIGKVVMARRAEIQAALEALEAGGRAGWTPGRKRSKVWDVVLSGE